MKFEKLYINGAWVGAASGRSIQVVDPATEEVCGEVPQAADSDVDAAVRAARQAFPAWSTTSAAVRAQHLRALADGLKHRGAQLAQVITMEMGMPASMSFGYQVEPPIAVVESFIEVLEGFSFVRDNKTSFNLLEPVGVCALITPWNFPLTQVLLKLAPALAAGCTTVLKPSEFTPLSATLLAQIVDEAGLPPGVFNLVHGSGESIGQALAAHPQVDLISLTGSTRAGRSVAARAADTLKRVTLELGGKSPNIICDDADFAAVIPAGVNKCFVNSGQACDAPTRMLVPHSRYAEALVLAKEAAESLVVGDPRDESVQLGPLVNAAQYQHVNGMIQAGIDEGAQVVCGGPGRPAGLSRGYYVKPTVFAGVRNDMRIAQEEIFGPVLCIVPYRDDEDAVRIANDTRYGLAAYVHSASELRAAAIAVQLRAGQVRVNRAPFDIYAPFGGYKMSGYGRELGEQGLEEFLEVKACMGLSRQALPANRRP